MHSKQAVVLAVLFILFTSVLMIISCDTTGCDSERLLNIDAPDVEILNVSHSNSLYKYVDTKQFFIFAEQKVVLTIFFDNTTFPFPIETAFHVFSRTESLQKIKQWVNNQHSDAIYGNAARPIREEPLPLDRIKIFKYGIHGSSTGDFGDEYHNYIVEYGVEPYTITGLLSLEGFSYDAPVYYRVKDIDR